MMLWDFIVSSEVIVPHFLQLTTVKGPSKLKVMVIWNSENIPNLPGTQFTQVSWEQSIHQFVHSKWTILKGPLK